MILLPRIVLIEKYVIEELGRICKKLQLPKKCVIIADETTKKIAGDYAKDVLEEEGFKPKLEIINHIDKSTLEEMSKDLKTDFFVGTGGGRCIDVAKYLSFKNKVPFISIPTAPSHDGIASDRASLDTEDGKVSVHVEPPIAIIADIELMQSCPEKNISSGCADVLSNITAVTDWRMSNEYVEFIGDLSLLASNIVMSHSRSIVMKSERGLKALVWSEVLSGFAMSMAGDSSPASGSDHNFSHALDSLGSKALHGEQCGLGSIIASYLQRGNWVKMKSVLKEVRAPITAKEAGIPEDMVIEALVKAKSVRNRKTILDKYDITEEKAKAILKTVGII